MFDCRIQHFNFEEGEFETWEKISSHEALKLFNEFDWTGEIEKKQKEDIYPNLIVQSNDHLIKIYFLHSGLFDFFYFPPDEKKYFRIRGKQKEVEEAIKLFLSLRFLYLKESCLEMNTGLIDYNEQKKKLKEKSFIYNFSISNDLYYIIAIIPFSLFLGSIFVALQFAIIILLLFCIISIPLLLVFLPYYKTNKGMSLYLTRGKDEFFVTHNSKKVKYNKKNISKLVYYHNNGSMNNLYLDTCYMDILFSNGERIILNTFTIDKISMAKKFREQEIILKNVTIPYIRKNISIYY